MRNQRFDVLFEPVSIGPVTAPNRFYQVPHCTGMGYRYPQSEAHVRGMKAEGGWGVVSTQEAEIHATSDLTPANEARIWDKSDIPALRLMTDAVHEHGSLAAIQLVHNGLHTSNAYSRLPPIAPSAAVIDSDAPVQAREMSKHDIAAFRQWHKSAAKRSMVAGFDIVYVYAGHDMTLLQHFLLQRHNHRSDEYGGTLTNRLRLFKEVIADTRDVVGDRCAVAVRMAVDELMGEAGLQCDAEARDIIEALAEEPDLWDVNLSDWSNDSQSARFSAEGYQEPYTAFVKSVTTKPVVGVGRYTSPDTMLRLVQSGHLDFIGAARPSIADPFLPLKIAEGRSEDIRECIGCNICVPERVNAIKTKERCLVVGGGPSGLEAARVLAERGFGVTLVDAANKWGGRVNAESALPGLASWSRVSEWRVQQLQRMSNVSMYLGNELTAEDILGFDAQHIALATGATWRCDGVGRTDRSAQPHWHSDTVVGVDALMNNAGEIATLHGPVLVYDDDRFYLASALAEKVIEAGKACVFVTPASVVAPWTENTLEQSRIQRQLLSLGVRVVTGHSLVGIDSDEVSLRCIYSDKIIPVSAAAVVPVTGRLPKDGLWRSMLSLKSDWASADVMSVQRIGDCYTPGIIAAAVHAGHAYGRLGKNGIWGC